MKRFAEKLHPKRPEPRRGYVAACKACGLLVVHARSTGEPFHMHRRSRKCAERAAQLRIDWK